MKYFIILLAMFASACVSTPKCEDFIIDFYTKHDQKVAVEVAIDNTGTGAAIFIAPGADNTIDLLCVELAARTEPTKNARVKDKDMDQLCLSDDGIKVRYGTGVIQLEEPELVEE